MTCSRANEKFFSVRGNTRKKNEYPQKSSKERNYLSLSKPEERVKKKKVNTHFVIRRELFRMFVFRRTGNVVLIFLDFFFEA